MTSRIDSFSFRFSRLLLDTYFELFSWGAGRVGCCMQSSVEEAARMGGAGKIGSRLFSLLGSLMAGYRWGARWAAGAGRSLIWIYLRANLSNEYTRALKTLNLLPVNRCMPGTTSSTGCYPFPKSQLHRSLQPHQKPFFPFSQAHKSHLSQGGRGKSQERIQLAFESQALVYNYVYNKADRYLKILRDGLIYD